MSGPRAPHLEIRSAAPEGARFLAGLAQREGVELGVLDRGRHAVAYAKGAEAIGAVLAAAVIHSLGGGSVFVRRRIQTPSDATVQNTVQPEREVVLGASSSARRASRERSAAGLRALAGAPAKPARLR